METLIKSAIYRRLAIEANYTGQKLEFITEREGIFIYLVEELSLLCSYDNNIVSITKITPL